MGIQAKTMSLCGLCAAGVFVFLGLSAKNYNQQLEANGLSFPGTITRVEVQSGSKGKKRYVIDVAWGEGQGRREGDKFVVTKSFFESKVGVDSAILSPEVTIRHLPGAPDSAIILGGTSDLGGMEWLGGIIGIVSLIGTFLSFRPRPTP